MPRLFYEEKAVRTPTKLLLGLALLLLVPFALAQNNLGELLDAGAKSLSAEEFRQEVLQRTIVGISPAGATMEVMYAPSGVIQGRSAATGTIQGGLTGSALSSIDGVWNVDDSGKICTSMVIGRVFLPLRCQFWFKYKEDYFIADSNSDRKARVFRRTVKQ
jgi:3-oxoacyl-ACP reductase-like protein